MTIRGPVDSLRVDRSEGRCETSPWRANQGRKGSRERNRRVSFPWKLPTQPNLPIPTQDRSQRSERKHALPPQRLDLPNSHPDQRLQLTLTLHCDVENKTRINPTERCQAGSGSNLLEAALLKTARGECNGRFAEESPAAAQRPGADEQHGGGGHAVRAPYKGSRFGLAAHPQQTVRFAAGSPHGTRGARPGRCFEWTNSTKDCSRRSPSRSAAT